MLNLMKSVIVLGLGLVLVLVLVSGRVSVLCRILCRVLVVACSLLAVVLFSSVSATSASASGGEELKSQPIESR